MHVAYMHRF